MGSSKNTEFYLINSFLLETICVKKKKNPNGSLKQLLWLCNFSAQIT